MTNQLKTIIAREYRERVRQKGFIATTLIGLLVIVGMSFAPAIMDKIRSADRLEFTILEQTGEVGAYLENALQDTLPSGEKEIQVTEAVQGTPETWASEKERLVAQVQSGGVPFLEVFPPDAPQSVVWHSQKTLSSSETGKVQTAIQQWETQKQIEASGISPDQVSKIFTPLNFETQLENNDKDSGGLRGDTHEQQIQNVVLVYFLLFMLYFALVIYGAYVAQGVIEEKSSRIMEMMLATVKPTTMMAGKILGIGAVGLTQYLVWIGAGIALLSFKGGGLFDSLGLSFSLQQVDPVMFIYFGVFFVLGFLMYAAIYAGLGSTVSRVEDANQVVSPFTMLIVVAFMIAMFSLGSPDNPWIVGLTYVPFFTPMLLFTRIVLTNVSPLSIGIGIGELVLTIIVLMWLAAKIYRTGVLMYGKVSWKHVFRILRNK